MSKLHLIMPMGGAGLRFSQSIGFDMPKPLIPLREKPFLYWAVKAVTERMPVKSISFIVLKEHIEKFNIDKTIYSYFPNANIAILQEQLNGPVLTCYEGIKQLDISGDEWILVNDCDHVFESIELSRCVKEGVPTSGLVTFKSSEPQFSYIKYNDCGEIIGTAEKETVSERAICGAYLFKDVATFLSAAEEYMKTGLGSYKEFFISGMYNILAQREPIDIFDATSHVSFGTPAEYESAQSKDNDLAFTF